MSVCVAISNIKLINDEGPKVSINAVRIVAFTGNEIKPNTKCHTHEIFRKIGLWSFSSCSVSPSQLVANVFLSSLYFQCLFVLLLFKRPLGTRFLSGLGRELCYDSCFSRLTRDKTGLKDFFLLLLAANLCHDSWRTKRLPAASFVQGRKLISALKTTWINSNAKKMKPGEEMWRLRQANCLCWSFHSLQFKYIFFNSSGFRFEGNHSCSFTRADKAATVELSLLHF